MKKPITSFGIAVAFSCVTQAVILTAALGADQPATTQPAAPGNPAAAPAARRAQPRSRLPTDPGTPALIPAGPKAEELAKSWQKKLPSADDAASNQIGRASCRERV